MLRLLILFMSALTLSIPGSINAAVVAGIANVLPAPGATGVDPSTPLSIEFTQPTGYAYTDSRKLRIFDISNGTEVYQSDPDAGDAQENDLNYTLTLPPGILKHGRDYRVTLDTGFANLNIAPWKSGYIGPGIWEFSTATAEPDGFSPEIPNIVSVFPAPGAIDVATDTDLIIEFPMAAYFGYTEGSFLSVVEAVTGQVVFELDPAAGDPQEGSDTMIVTLPAATLKPETTYEIQLDYSFATVNVDPWKTWAIDAGRWTFTTGRAPTGSLATPVDGIVQVSPRPGSSGLDPDNVTLTVYLAADSYYSNTTDSALNVFELGASVPVFSVDPDETELQSGNAIYSVVIPGNLLKEDTVYTVGLDYQFARLTTAPWRTGLSDPGNWTFVTGSRTLTNLTPAIEGVIGVVPAPGQTGVDADAVIEVHFAARSTFGYTDSSQLRVIDTRDDAVVLSVDPGYQDAQENRFSYAATPGQLLASGVTYRVEVDYGFSRFNQTPWILGTPLSWEFTVAGSIENIDPPDDPEDNGDGSGDGDSGGDGNGDTDGDGDGDGDGSDGGSGNGDSDGNGDGSDDVPPQNQVDATASTVLFVTQTPLSGVSFGTVISNFSNHVPMSRRAPRGGDLWIRYADGTLRNLTAEAGFGNEGMQGANSIAVRTPSVHWSGTKALFAMVVGSPALYETTAYYWQIYEVTGLGQGEAVSISKVANQPVDYNNVSPIYAATSMNGNADEDIIFVSDITHGGRHLYPQYEEYDGAPTNTGLFRLDRASGELRRLTHAPSGDFTPIIDSFGRMIFTRWDHLQQDQQNGALIGGLERFGAAINYVDESVGAAVDTVNGAVDIFPEHLVEVNPDTGVPYVVGNETGMRFNQFFLWESSPIDGSENEVLNHLGRQELGQSYTRGRFVDDAALTDITTSFLGGHTANSVPIYAPGGVFHAKEDPLVPGAFIMTHAQEFAFCGELLYLEGAPSINPESVVIQKRTEYFDTSVIDGCYRNPLATSDGVIIAAYAPGDFANSDDHANTFRLRFVNDDGTPGANLTGGLSKSLSYWSPDFQIDHIGNLWELDPVEVRARTKPATIMHAGNALSAPEQAACEIAYGNSAAACEAGMNELRDYLQENKLALVVSRNITSRDDSDTQQPFNLRVPGGVESDASQGAGNLYDVTHLQFLQANLVRGYANRPNGRRPLAQLMVDDLADGLNNSIAGAMEVKHDGSVAAIVPAERAITWHLVDEAQGNKSIVSERYWVSFAAGEVRVCANCHGINDLDQMGNPEPTNAPQALTDLLNAWQTRQSLLE